MSQLSGHILLRYSNIIYMVPYRIIIKYYFLHIYMITSVIFGKFFKKKKNQAEVSFWICVHQKESKSAG